MWWGGSFSHLRRGATSLPRPRARPSTPGTSSRRRSPRKHCVHFGHSFAPDANAAALTGRFREISIRGSKSGFGPNRDGWPFRLISTRRVTGHSLISVRCAWKRTVERSRSATARNSRARPNAPPASEAGTVRSDSRRDPRAESAYHQHRSRCHCGTPLRLGAAL